MLLAMEGPFSAAVLAELLEAGHAPVAVALPGPGPAAAPGLPVTVAPAPGSVPDLAARAGAPLHRVTRPLEDALGALMDALRPDLLAVACFPWRVPETVTRRAGAGAVNLHPSLLPRYRGPEPLFWQLRAAEEATGVTLHRVAPALDAGPILAQAEVPLPLGASGPMLEALLGRRGAALLADLLAGARLRERPQEERLATAQAMPGPADFSVGPGWAARHAYGFLRGTAHWGLPYPWEGGAPVPALAAAAGFRDRAPPTWRPAAPPGVVTLPCARGVLHALPAGQDSGAGSPR
jgi:methionyl-tRNA formyltransferase